MANPKRGEVEIETPDGTRYTLKLTINAACEVQKRTDKTLREILLAAMVGDQILTRELVWLLLQPSHAQAFKTLEKVGDWMDEFGPPHQDTVLKAKIIELLEVNQPPERHGDQTAEGADAANPQSGQAGTSAGGSSLTLAASA